MPKINNENQTLVGWCKKNGHPGVTKECMLSAFNSSDPEVQSLAKREKLKGLAAEKEGI